MDPFELMIRGIILNNRTFDGTFFIDYLLGLLNFLYYFYTKVGFFGYIHISLQIEGAA